MILSFDDLDAILTLLKNKKIVFTNGCFDILHAGHIHYLKQAKSLGDVLFVGVNSDISVKKIKGKTRPINSLRYRLFVLDSIKWIDYLIPFDETKPIKLIKKLKPCIYVKGGDYLNKQLDEAEVVKSYGGKVKIINIEHDISTTEIIKKIRGAR